MALICRDANSGVSVVSLVGICPMMTGNKGRLIRHKSWLTNPMGSTAVRLSSEESSANSTWASM